MFFLRSWWNFVRACIGKKYEMAATIFWPLMLWSVTCCVHPHLYSVADYHSFQDFSERIPFRVVAGPWTWFTKKVPWRPKKWSAFRRESTETGFWRTARGKNWPSGLTPKRKISRREGRKSPFLFTTNRIFMIFKRADLSVFPPVRRSIRETFPALVEI